MNGATDGVKQIKEAKAKVLFECADELVDFAAQQLGDKSKYLELINAWRAKASKILSAAYNESGE